MKLGGLICHVIFIPPWVFFPVLSFVATALLLSAQDPVAASGVLAVQIAMAALAYKNEEAASGAVALSLGVTSYFLAHPASDPLAAWGAGIWTLMHVVTFGLTFPFVPAFTRLVFWLDMRSYYKRCELRGALDSMGRSHTLYMFHPHGVLSVGFSANGVWSKDFNERSYPADGTPAGPDEPGWRGTVFLIAKSLRVPSVFFKALCDLSGRLESATRETILPLMAAGRNLCIIPGGFEDATLFARGKHRTAMKGRKGIVKYALQHGYKLQPVYTFGESRTFATFSGLLALRLRVNALQLPAVAFWGDWRCPLFPRADTECVSCVGPPLQLPTLPQPTAAEVDEWHARYLAALTDLFEKHKAELGEPEATLEIW